MINLLSIAQYKGIIIAIAVAIILTILLLFLAKKLAENQITYEKKNSLLTPLEKRYYEEFCSIFGDNYLVLPQINLATVINKTSPGYRTELFRNIDFGVFDKDFHPLVLIEINDPSHLRPDREERDANVKTICKKAKIPLVTFWTKDGIDRNEFIKAFKKAGL